MDIRPHRNRPARTRATTAIAAAAAALGPWSPLARAGGTSEYAILVIDPSSADSMRVGNYYKNARNIPDANVLYLKSTATSYAAFCSTVTPALLGTLDQRSITDHISYIIVAPFEGFYVPASGLLIDPCSPVNRFSTTAAYTTAMIRNDVLPGSISVTLTNQYYSNADQAVAFDATSSWLSGSTSASVSAKKYFISGMLGCTTTTYNINTVPQILTMIDRSVAVDGTRPAGTFYFMSTADVDRNVRSPTYPSAVTGIIAHGGAAQLINGNLPNGHNDCLGIMTGVADLDIPGAGITILPGAFCDHLTSWAATFDIGAQTKVGAWISAGASASAGEVEEPCNYQGKFPNAYYHKFYLEGLSAGEAYLRSVAYVPFQGLFYGDPLTRPFAYIPAVSVPDAPSGPVSGTLTLTPSATTAAPGIFIAGYDLVIDGVRRQTTTFGQQFSFNTQTLDDGPHDLRVLARDTSPVKSVGRWIGTFTTSNYARSATCGLPTSSGDLVTLFDFPVAASGPTAVQQIRLVQNGRVIAATNSASATLRLFGQNLGAGVSKVHAEATFVGGRTARSAPVTVTVSPTGALQGFAPVAFGYDKPMYLRNAYAVELPAAFDTDPVFMTYTLLTSPAQATVAAGTTGAYRIITPNSNASGSETISFRVQNPGGGASSVATITLVYTQPIICPADFDNNGAVEPADVANFINVWLASLQQATLAGDFDHNGAVQPADVALFVSTWFNALVNGC